MRAEQGGCWVLVRALIRNSARWGVRTDLAETMPRLLFVFLVISGALFAAEADDLIGTWKLVSWQVIVKDRPPQNVFGAHPKGFLILTREGRGIVVTTAENRQAGMGDSERAALHK